MPKQQFLCLVIFAALAACGGGGSGGSVSNPDPVATATPTPTPSPSATFTYTKTSLAEPFLQQVTSVGLRVVRRYQDNPAAYYGFESGSVTMGDYGETTISWTPTTRTFSLTRDTSATFTQNELYPDAPENGVVALNYLRRVTGHPTLRDYVANTTLRFSAGQRLNYIWLGALSEDAGYFDEPTRPRMTLFTTRRFIAGPITAPGDLPTSGVVRWFTELDAITLVGDFINGIGWSDGRINIDFAARTIGGTVMLRQTSGETGTAWIEAELTLAANIDSSGRVRGTLRSADGAFTGQMVGYFYGPQAAELGLVVQMTFANGTRPIAGILIGRRYS